MSVLDLGHSHRSIVLSHCSLNVQFPRIHDVEHLFICFFLPFVYIFGEVSIQILCPFFNWVVCFLIVDFKRPLYILDQ